MPPLRGIGVGDTHDGSPYSLLPTNFIDSHGNLVKQNKGQEYLWGRWLQLGQEAKSFQPDFFIINGDVTEGKQRKQEGSELVLPLIADQEEAAYRTFMVLRDACPRAAFYFVQGTEYHDDFAGRSVESVAQRMGACEYPGVGSGRYAKEVANLVADGLVFNIQHHIGTSVNRTTALEKEMHAANLAYAEGRIPFKVYCVIRSHIHHYVHVEWDNMQGVVLPCWQLQTRFMRKKSAFTMMPSLGAAFFSIDRKDRYNPCRIQSVLYPQPQCQTYKIG